MEESEYSWQMVTVFEIGDSTYIKLPAYISKKWGLEIGENYSFFIRIEGERKWKYNGVLSEHSENYHRIHLRKSQMKLERPEPIVLENEDIIEIKLLKDEV